MTQAGASVHELNGSRKPLRKSIGPNPSAGRLTPGEDCLSFFAPRQGGQGIIIIYTCYQHREPEVQRFEVIEDYQAEGWSRSRRIVAKLEINRHGVNRRFVVTNLSGQGQGIYHGFYVQRGDVPEKPIGELKNGLQMDRLSFHRFRANGLKLLAPPLPKRYEAVLRARDLVETANDPCLNGQHARFAVPWVGPSQLLLLRT